jgi:hypothetical protein
LADVDATPKSHSQSLAKKMSKMLETVSKTLPLMGTRVGLTVTFLDSTTSTANGYSITLKPSKTKSREYMPIFSNEGQTQPTEKSEMKTAGTEEKLKLQVALKSIGDMDVTVIMMPPSICTTDGWIDLKVLGCTYWKFQKIDSMVSDPTTKETLRGLEQQFWDEGGKLQLKEFFSEL